MRERGFGEVDWRDEGRGRWRREEEGGLLFDGDGGEGDQEGLGRRLARAGVGRGRGVGTDEEGAALGLRLFLGEFVEGERRGFGERRRRLVGVVKK